MLNVDVAVSRLLGVERAGMVFKPVEERQVVPKFVRQTPVITA
jgi:hypothetical protein